jgi:hypothetical protein
MGATIDYIEELFEEYQKPELEFNGTCHDCKVTVKILVTSGEEGNLNVEGGSLYKINGIEKPFLRCDCCFGKDPALRDYQPCEVYTRVVGYLRPVQQFNIGKKEEFKARKTFNVEM